MTKNPSPVSVLEDEFIKLYKNMSQLVQLSVEGIGQNTELVKAIKDSTTEIDALIDKLTELIPVNVPFNSFLDEIKGFEKKYHGYNSKFDAFIAENMNRKEENFKRISEITNDFLN